jgi:hypothetical protein
MAVLLGPYFATAKPDSENITPKKNRKILNGRIDSAGLRPNGGLCNGGLKTLQE